MMSSLEPANRRRLLAVCVAALTLSGNPIEVRGQSPAWLDRYREPAARLIGEATGDTFAWKRLAILTDTIGHRLSVSPQLERAIEWAVAEMNFDVNDTVHTEKVMVPHWVRGN